MSTSKTGLTSLIPLLTSFRGRISRKSWWIGYIIMFFGSLLGTALLNPEFFTAEQIPPSSWPDTIWQLAWLIPGTAITVKRLNDRDWPWWPGYVVGALIAFLYLAPHFGLQIDPQASGMGRVLFGVLAVLLLLVFVDNGFNSGTDGPNRYGPDPLQRSLGTP